MSARGERHIAVRRARRSRGLPPAKRDETVDLGVANTILRRAGIPPISRRWKVHLRVPFTVEVIASSEQDAFGIAEELITESTDEEHRPEMNSHARDAQARPGELIR